MKVGVLTGGGDCPGLNAVIRAIVRRSVTHGFEVMGLREGWRGLLELRHRKLTQTDVSGILPLGGTILGTSRANPFQVAGGAELTEHNARHLGLSAVIAIGGEGTLSIAREMHRRGRLKVVGVPKTIDNDISATDYTFGFDTAVQIATEAIDRLHTTAESHSRVMVVEVMGRHVGHIALHAGLASGADAILIPERPFRVEDVCRLLERRHRTKHSSIVVVAEGARVVDEGGGARLVLANENPDDFGRPRLGGVGAWLAARIEARLGIETRVTVLGHVQRGGTPTARDRVLATRFGVKAADLVHEGRFGEMAALRGTRIVSVPLEEATRALKTVDEALYEVAETFFG
ncbi:MAG: 6-phosphofructokinase [Deltaproteobacteria bacterium]|nr:MAG: 6-phosphofructokinase [Deltaproteobacteria bacterium]